MNKNSGISSGRLVQLVGAASSSPKGCGFHSWSGHIPRLWVPFLVRMGRRCSLSLFLFLSLSLPLCKVSKHILGWRLKNYNGTKYLGNYCDNHRKMPISDLSLSSPLFFQLGILILSYLNLSTWRYPKNITIV